MSDLYIQYESDVRKLMADTQSRVEQTKSLGGEQRKTGVRQMERSLDECRDIVSQMENEVRNNPSSKKSSRGIKMRNIKTEIEQINRDLNKLKNDSSTGLYDSQGDSYGTTDPKHDPQRQRLLNAHSQIDRTNERLRNSERIALESESMGNQVLSDLSEQRQLIDNSTRDIERSDATLRQADKKMRDMECRRVGMKLLGAFIALVVLIIIGLICYYALKK